jgi:hypothetical protein
MSVDKRSPWVVLGIPFSADRAAAKRAFVRRSRQLRANADLPWTEEDVTWAEAALTLAVEQPDATVGYFRVPATPEIFERPREGELFVPESRPSPRRTQTAAHDVLDEECAQLAITKLGDWLESLQPEPAFDPYAQPIADEKEVQP